WQHLRKAEGGRMKVADPATPSGDEALIVAEWPRADKKFFDARAEKEFAALMDIVRVIRNARAEFNVEPGKRIPAIIAAGSAAKRLDAQRDTLALLARLDPNEFRIETRAEKPAQALASMSGKIEIYLPLAGMIDVEKEKARLAGDRAKVNGDIARAQTLLAGEFSKRAPKDVVQKTRDSLAANQERAARLAKQLDGLEGRELRNTKIAKGTKAAKAKPNARKKSAKRNDKKRATKKPTRKRGMKKSR
ncbi:MAG TPA: class I tRNA ligase family protein, partial [Anaerolineae bacterium]